MSGQPQARAYPGNLSLPVEVREKILSTFRHTLDLFRDGKLDDCLIGCDFILKMDPRFAPARKLQEKAKNPKADVDLAELRVFAASSAAPQPPPARETGPVKPATPASQGSSRTTPWISPGDSGTAAAPRDTDPAAVEGLESLSLDSLSLDGPLSDLSEPGGSREAGLPFAAGLGPGDVSVPAFGDFSRGPSAGDSDLASPPAISTEQEIAALLRQGDDANAGGDKQQAIEIWSRIFLLDINNADAVSRIEKTRAEMAEESRRVAAALEQGQQSFEKGDLASARKQFDAVLHLDEEPPGAVPPSPPVAAGPAPPSPHDLSSVVATGDVLAEEMEQSGPPGKRSWSSTLRPRSEPSAEKPDEEASKRPTLRVNRRVAILGGVILAVVAAGVFVVTRPRGTTTQVERSGSAPSLEHATALFREGKIAETTEELRRIPRSDPDYAKAQKLLASLEAPKASAESAPAASAPAPAAALPQTVSNPATLRAEAEKALSEKRYIDAMKAFSAAAPSFMADPAFAKEMASASEKVTELTPAVKLYNDGEYETAIPILWRIYQASRDNQDARSYLLRSYFNQGIAQLQNGLYDKAKESFNEVLGLDPHDVEAARHVEFADHYRSGDLDLLGRIYVRYISPRP